MPDPVVLPCDGPGQHTAMPAEPEEIVIRPASLEDCAALAELSIQLGYPSSPEQVRQRLEGLLPHRLHAVYVAEHPDGAVVGWVHVFVQHLLVADRHAEVGGLVVGQAYQGRGVGRLLTQAAEKWARAAGCTEITLRSNVVRQAAHRFYRQIGYTQYKEQKAFRKRL